VDDSRFDELVRAFGSGSAPRRSALRGLTGVILGVLGWSKLEDVQAHDLLAKCKKIKVKKKKKACVKKARKHAAQHLGEGPSSSPDLCAGVRCPAVSNGTVVCQNGACVIASCDPNFTQCGNACVDTQDDAQHCGKCGVQCPGNDANRCVSGKCEQMFRSFGTSWPYTAPAEGTLHVEAIGAQGGAGSASTAGSPSGAGGLGGKSTGSFTVASQERLLIGVGEAGWNADGQAFGRGGVNGGGNGQNGQPGSGGGGGGGGASDVRRDTLAASDPLVFAKGGGGGGGGGTGGGAGGTGGGGTAGGLAGQPGQSGNGFQFGQGGDGMVTVTFTAA
jgi:hypothetical protein